MQLPPPPVPVVADDVVALVVAAEVEPPPELPEDEVDAFVLFAPLDDDALEAPPEPSSLDPPQLAAATTQDASASAEASLAVKFASMGRSYFLPSTSRAFEQDALFQNRTCGSSATRSALLLRRSIRTAWTGTRGVGRRRDAAVRLNAGPRKSSSPVGSSAVVDLSRRVRVEKGET